MRKKDDAAARRARARELRMQIEGLKSGKREGGASGEESPKEFVERRARELLEAERKRKGKRRRASAREGARRKAAKKRRTGKEPR
jgi:hypothetical protein